VVWGGGLGGGVGGGGGRAGGFEVWDGGGAGGVGFAEGGLEVEALVAEGEVLALEGCEALGSGFVGLDEVLLFAAELAHLFGAGFVAVLELAEGLLDFL